MKWFAKILTAIATFNMAVAPAFAKKEVKPVEPSEKYTTELVEYRKFLEPLGYRVHMDKANNRALVYDFKNNTLAMEIPFADEAYVRKYNPKSVNKMLMDEMIKVRKASAGAISHSLRNLAPESAMFFMAMGAVVSAQLFMNYSQNPVGMAQHVEHSMSPLGVMGFFTFMATQGVTSNILSMYFKNPKFHYMIPYLGMTAGAFVQTYLSQVASDPNVIACAKVMLKKDISANVEEGADSDPCSKAFEYLVVNKKIWEFSPGIASMLISSAIAAAGTSGLKAGMVGTKVGRAALRMSGVDIAAFIAPGGMQVKGLRFLLVKGLQLTVFVSLDVLLNRAVTYAWKNMYDGADFYDVNDNLNEQMNLMKKKNWEGSDADLHAEVKDFKKRMSDWRQMNLSAVYEAHHAWSQALGQMTSMYLTSYKFYNTFANEIRDVQLKKEAFPKLTKPYLLHGVVDRGLNKGFEDQYHEKPNQVEFGQRQTVTEVAKAGLLLLKSEETKTLFEHESAKLKSIFDKLAKNDLPSMAAGLTELRKEYEHLLQNVSVSEHYREIVRSVFAALGNPDPVYEPGRGFLRTYESAPTTAATLKGTSFYRKVGSFLTPNITDNLIMQMMCGPDLDKGESVLRQSLGYPSVFLPPQMKNGSDKFNFCEMNLQMSYPNDDIYKTNVTGQSKKQYRGMIDYLVNEARPSMVGNGDKSNLTDWWTAKVDPQMEAAFEQYAKSYDEIVAKLITGIYEPGRSMFNGRPLLRNPVKTFEALYTEKGKLRQMSGGPIYNGAINSAFQEERVYLSLLEELLNPAKEFSVDFAKTLEKAPTHKLTKDVENEFIALNELLKRIQVKKEEGRLVVKSDLENVELEKQVEKVQAALTEVAKEFGVQEEKEKSQELETEMTPEPAVKKYAPNQQRLVTVLLESLQALASEMMTYGTIANAVSWDKMRNLKESQNETAKNKGNVNRNRMQMLRNYSNGAN